VALPETGNCRAADSSSEEQTRDAFRAGGYTHEEVERYTQVMRKRIAVLGALSSGRGRADTLKARGIQL
jgi:hypothetical protein